jgi:hypothetical protein
MTKGTEILSSKAKMREAISRDKENVRLDQHSESQIASGWSCDVTELLLLYDDDDDEF